MHPILFHLGPVPVYGYGVFLLTAVLTGLAILPRYARRAGVPPDHAKTFFFVAVTSGLLGSRLLQIVQLWPRIMEHPELFWTLLRSNGVLYGGLLAGVASAGFYGWRRRLSPWRLLDMAAVPVMVAAGIGRLGCFLTGCCYGRPTDLPWGVSFTNELAHRMNHDLPWVPLHPVQIYDFLAAMGLALVLDRLSSRPFRPGQLGLAWLALYGVTRSAIEFFRGDAIRGAAFGLSTSQIIGLSTAVVAAVLWVRRGRRSEQDLVPQNLPL